MVLTFHSVLAYLASQPAAPEPFDSPPYHWLATPILDNQRWLGLDIYAAFQYVALMPVMFFMSGIFVWPSLVRRGSWNFVYGRLVRIGLPFVFGVSDWAEFGPFGWQPDRPLLYLVYFFAGVGIGVQGYDRGLLRPGGKLAQRWHIWLGCAAVTFLSWMATMAPATFGHSNVLI